MSTDGWPDSKWTPEVLIDGLWRLRTPMTSEALPWVFIHSLMISHAHPDHLGMASWIKESAPNCKIMMIDVEADWYADNGRGSRNWVEQNDLWMVRHGVLESEIDAESEAVNKRSSRIDSGDRDQSWFHRKINPDLLLQDNDLIEIGNWSLQAVWTPGHTPGHLCVYIPDHDLLLTGHLMTKTLVEIH